jgi:hypothetical protein
MRLQISEFRFQIEVSNLNSNLNSEIINLKSHETARCP